MRHSAALVVLALFAGAPSALAQVAGGIRTADTPQAPTRAASAQVPQSGPAAPPTGGSTQHGPFWFAAGGGVVSARGHCSDCDRAGVYLTSGSLLIDGGLRVNPRVDAGMEVSWVSSAVEGTSPVRTTFVLGLGQFRPWLDRGFLIRAGMGLGFAGNGIYNPTQRNLKPPFTTNALALTYGIGWVFRREERLAMQVHGGHYVVAIGELTTVDGTTIQNVVGNYWMVTGALVIR